jgi:hypothetical protein
MLVNDRQMCSFMSNEKLDELVDGSARKQERRLTMALDLSSFRPPAWRPVSMTATSRRRSMPG